MQGSGVDEPASFGPHALSFTSPTTETTAVLSLVLSRQRELAKVLINGPTQCLVGPSVDEREIATSPAHTHAGALPVLAQSPPDESVKCEGVSDNQRWFSSF